jgi:hypothetical protein
MRRRVLLILLGTVLVGAAVLVHAATTGRTPVAPSGTAHADPATVSLAGSHALPDIQPAQPRGQDDADDPDAAGDTAGGAGPAKPAGPHAASRPAVNGQNSTVKPLVAPTVVKSFDGINQTQVCSGCVPPDPNSASSGSEIVELTNTFIQVTDINGTILCNGGVTLNRLLRSTDVLTDPRIQYDNVNNRFSLVVTIKIAKTDTPALWVAASDTADACGTWRTYRLTFSGGPFNTGVFLDFPMLGQDRNALLISTRNIDQANGTATTFTVFGLPKSTIYAGNSVSFNTFNVTSLTAPVTNAGVPMISSSVSYFLAAVPGTGYKLYTLTNSGGSGAVLTTQATISASYSKPSRNAAQPNTSATIDASDGNILVSPYFDGTNIWFAHDFDLAGFPTIRYGAVNVNTNAVTTAMAYHSNTSDDFNPSLTIGLTSSGVAVYLNWAYTDAPNGQATSDVIDSLPAGQAISNLLLSSTVLVNGSSIGTSGNNRFGDYSSVSIDPSVPGGTCAWTTQQYFLSTGNWSTRIARVGNCQPPPPPVAVPDLTGDTQAGASSALSSAGLVLGQVSVANDNTCNNIGTVMSQNPGAGVQVAPGTSVNITIGQKPPAPFTCP